MRVVKVQDTRALWEAKEVLESGKLVVSPTDTIYGILADATQEKAVNYLRRIRRHTKKPFILLIPSLLWLRKLALLTDSLALRLISLERTTLVIKRKTRIPLYLTLGRDSLAVRLPKKGFIRDLLIIMDKPLVAPSVNPEGKRPAKSIGEAIAYFGDSIDLYIDAGKIEGNPSTIIALERGHLRVLRGKPLTPEDRLKKLA